MQKDRSTDGSTLERLGMPTLHSVEPPRKKSGYSEASPSPLRPSNVNTSLCCCHSGTILILLPFSHASHDGAMTGPVRCLRGST